MLEPSSRRTCCWEGAKHSLIFARRQKTKRTIFTRLHVFNSSKSEKIFNLKNYGKLWGAGCCIEFNKKYFNFIIRSIPHTQLNALNSTVMVLWLQIFRILKFLVIIITSYAQVVKGGILYKGISKFQRECFAPQSSKAKRRRAAMK